MIALAIVALIFWVIFAFLTCVAEKTRNPEIASIFRGITWAAFIVMSFALAASLAGL